MTRNSLAFLLTILIGISLIGFFFFGSEDPVDYSTEIKPILNKHCISCHGGVKKNGGFSLLFEEEAFAIAESGHAAIIPGDPEGSELIRRLTETDPELRMPYQRTPLSETEINLLKTWIKQGAKWGKHWAYEPVEAPQIPITLTANIGATDPKLTASNIDFFVGKKLQELNLTPSPEEEKMKLLRRAALDITGLPPSEGLIQAYQSDKLSYDQAIQTLLASPAYGEKWATWWLDLARYADTKGYERDVSRTMWPFRDWVIRAFNEDKPFDQFTIEQLAGDLLPNPTQDQMIATAFHRNTMNNDEGGTQDEEFRVAAILDRVSTTYEVWQSTTMACVQCHSHPYDPIRHEEFYESAAFLNNTRDEDTHNEEPKLRFYSEDEKNQVASILSWVKEKEGVEKAKQRADFLSFYEPKYHAHLCEDFEKAELIDTKWLGLWPGGSAYLRNVNTQESDQLLIDYWSGIDGSKMTIRKEGPTGEILASFTLNKTEGEIVKAVPFKPIKGKIDLYLEVQNNNAKPQQNTSSIVWFAFVPSLPGKDQAGFSQVQKSWDQLLKFKGTQLPIMIENPDFMKRNTHVFERGNWLTLGEQVSTKIPAEWNKWNPDWPQNRLGFAYWITDKSNPLTARTLVNRVWDQLFGRGLVATLEDMGTQSDPPSHPQLLDYLAWQTMNTHHWSLKSLIREIVTSNAYKQKSAVTPTLYLADPQNKWITRGPRIRLNAEQIRDQALAVSGLLSPKMYGPGVKPHQPEGIWQTVYNGESWTQSQEEDGYRRGVYTFLKRTSPYPSFISFDAGSREVCLSRRIVTNTPLQALVTLNDPVYIEAAANLAKLMLDHNSNSPEKSIAFGYHKLMLYPISKEKKQALTTLYEQAMESFNSNPVEMAKFYPLNGQIPSSRNAAMTVVANALLNLDEFLTKP